MASPEVLTRVVEPSGGVRWGGVVPAALVLLLAGVRFLPSSAAKARAKQEQQLYERASQAYAAERFAEAAEYSRHALDGLDAKSTLRAELLCLRGEGLLRSGKPGEAVALFDEVVRVEPPSPYLPQALYSGAQAREALGDTAGATTARARLLGQFGGTPWAARLRAEGKGPSS